MNLAPGVLLIAEPAMLDPNFRRAVILLCDHDEENSFGLIINKPTDLHLTQVLEPIGLDHQLYLGGPVQPDTLHFLHSYSEEIQDAVIVGEGLALGGPFGEIAEQIREGALDHDRFRFFVGYAGWGPGQLAAEVEDASWLVLPATQELVFEYPAEHLWRDLILEIGGPLTLLVNYPEDPRTN